MSRLISNLKQFYNSHENQSVKTLLEGVSAVKSLHKLKSFFYSNINIIFVALIPTVHKHQSA